MLRTFSRALVWKAVLSASTYAQTLSNRILSNLGVFYTVCQKHGPGVGGGEGSRGWEVDCSPAAVDAGCLRQNTSRAKPKQRHKHENDRILPLKCMISCWMDVSGCEGRNVDFMTSVSRIVVS